MTLGMLSMDLLWQNALGAVPLALAVAAICRFTRCRASTRHALWLIVLLSLLAPPLLPGLNFSDDLAALSTRQTAECCDQPPGAAKPTPSAATNHTERATTTQAPPRGEARSNGTHVPPAIFVPPPVAPAASSDVSAPVDIDGGFRCRSSNTRGSIPFPPTSFAPAASGTSGTSGSAPHRSSGGGHGATTSASPTPSTQLPAPLSSLTASDRLPTSLRSSASHPKSSAASQGIEKANANEGDDDPRASNIAAGSYVISRWFDGLISRVEWRDWLVRVTDARDALVRLAPIPTSLWLGGCLVLASIMLIRIWRFRRVLRNSWPAPNDVLDVVEDCATALGLARLPRVLMTDARVSPLVWCGLRRTLVIPASLWEELDDTGRRAVLLHELAHLRRRDHWICWIEMFACTIYWWNPVAWWVRHRLRDEADYCCDAWVTAVLPTGGARTAYARALLTTRQYLTTTSSRLDAPSLALGVTSARTKRFARRLTMVMTERTAPRLSMCGTALALLLAGATWLATPLWACPPEEQTGSSNAAAAIAAKADKAAKAAIEKAAQGTKVKVPHTVVAAPTPEARVVTPRGIGSTFEQHMAGRDEYAAAVAELRAAQAPRGGGGLEERISHLEARMDRLTEHLEQLLGGSHATGMAPRAHAQPAMPPSPPAPPAVGGTMRGPVAQAGPGNRAPAPGARGGGMVSPRGAAPGQDSGEMMIRFYPLPSDKAEALFEFMRRDDVPVLVAPADGGIEVHGTAHQHEVFGAFIRLISPDGQQPGAMGPPAGGGEQRAMAEARLREAEGQLRAAREQFQRSRQQRGEQMRRQVEQQRQQMDQQRQKVRQRIEDLMKKARDLEHKAGEYERKAESLDDGPEKEDALAKAESLEAQAEELEAQADAQEDELDAQLEAIDAELEAQVEAFEDELDAQEEALESEMEAHMQALQAELEALAAAGDRAELR